MNRRIARLLRGANSIAIVIPPIPPPIYTYGATHNGVTPAPVAPDVSNRSELLAAWASATDGTIIALAGGERDWTTTGGIRALNLGGRTFSGSGPIIRAADYSDKPIWKGQDTTAAWLTLSNRTNLQGIEIYADTKLITGFSTIVAGSALNNIALRQCYVHGNPLGGLGTNYPPNTRAMNLNSGSAGNITVESCVVADLSALIGLAGGVSNVDILSNSFLGMAEHPVKGVKSWSDLTVTDNFFADFNPGWDAQPADPYLNHANASYIGSGTGGTGVVSGLLWERNILLSCVAERHATMLRLQWVSDAEVGDPSNVSGIVVRDNDCWGCGDMITINSAGDNPADVIVENNRLRYVNDAIDSIAPDEFARIRLNGSQLSLVNNDGELEILPGNTIQPNTGNINTGVSVSVSGAVARLAANALAATRGLQTSTSLGRI